MIQRTFDYLNHDLSPAATVGLTDAWRRTLERLGSYTGQIVQALNVRPSAAAVHAQTDKHLLIRLTVPQEHLILRIAPEADLAAYAYFLRTLAGHSVPVSRLIHRDLTRSMVPFAYVLETYVPGQSADQIDNEALLRAAARQSGRLLRRVHRITTPSAGRPSAVGRWPQQDWSKLLIGLSRNQRYEPTDRILFSDEERALLAQIPQHAHLQQVPIHLIHGDFGPHALRCTTGTHVHVEAMAGSGDDIGGDAMFDLALALRPCHGAAWCDGLLEGYLANGQFTEDERRRLALYQPLVNSWSACLRYQRGLPHEADLTSARDQLQALDGVVLTSGTADS